MRRAELERLAEVLRALHKAGRIRSPWLPGMAFHENATPGASLYRNGRGRCDDGRLDLPYAASPDLTDPATVGCLLALLREASGQPYAHVEAGPKGWTVWSGSTAFAAVVDGLAFGPTEGEAIAAALIALAKLVRALCPDDPTGDVDQGRR